MRTHDPRPLRRPLLAATSAVAGLALAAGAMVIAAPGASALLCGYPPKSCPAGQTNPSKDTKLGAGIVLLSQTRATRPDADRARLRQTGTPIADTSWPVRLSADLPRADTSYIVSVVLPSGAKATIGVVKSDRRGRATLPSMLFSRPGIVTFELRSSSGQVVSLPLNVVKS